MKKTTAILALFLAAFTWGSAFCVLKDTLEQVSPIWLLAFRFLLAGVIMAGICIPRFSRMKLQTLKRGIVMGCVLYCEFLFFTIGLQYTTSSKSSFIIGSYIAILPLIYWVIRKKKPQREDVLAALVCVAGLGFILLGSFDGINRGDLISLLSAVCYAIHIVVTGIFAREEDGFLLNMLQIGTGGILGLAAALLLEPHPASMTGINIGSIAYLAVFCTVVPYLLSVFGQKYVRTSTSGVILSFESVFGCLLSILVLGERPGFRFAIGAGLMMCSFLIVEKISVPRLKRVAAPEKQ